MAHRAMLAHNLTYVSQVMGSDLARYFSLCDLFNGSPNYKDEHYACKAWLRRNIEILHRLICSPFHELEVGVLETGTL